MASLCAAMDLRTTGAEAKLAAEMATTTGRIGRARHGAASPCAATDRRTSCTEAGYFGQMAATTSCMRPPKVVLQELLAVDSAPVRVAADGHLQGWRGPWETAGEKIARDDRKRAKEEQLA